MKMGGNGVISVASNVVPNEMADFVHAAQRGDWAIAENLDDRLHDLFRNLFIETNPIPGKAAMAHLGLMENSLRLPLVSATEETDALINKTLGLLWAR